MDRLEDLDVHMKAAVVGGGWAGIAAAIELAAAGASVTLFEAGRRLGGRARSVTIEGETLDNGQHVLLGAYRDTLATMRRVGARPSRLFARHPLLVQDDSGFRLALPRLPPPWNLAWGLMTARRVKLSDKLSTANWIDNLRIAGFKVEADTTVELWLDHARQTRALRRHLWDPLCLAALNTPPQRASARVFANVLRDSLGSRHRGDTDLLFPRGTLGQLLPEPAEKWLADHGAQLRLGHRVHAIQPRETGVVIDGEEFTAAVVAVAPQHLAKLLPDLACPYDYEPIATVYLRYPKGHGLPSPLYGLAGTGHWAVDRGDGLVAVVLSGHGAWEDIADADLANSLHGKLGLHHRPTWYAVIREKRATFSCRPGLHRATVRTRHPRLFLAGDHTWSEYPGTLEGAVRSGLAAARSALERSSREPYAEAATARAG